MKDLKYYECLADNITQEEWNKWGYDTDEICVICEDTINIKSEPRFNYCVCKKHSKIPPTVINEFTKIN